MHYTLHLTEACNLACEYCYVKQSPRSMSREIAFAAAELAAAGDPASAGLIFFGGEPLTRRELIYDIVAYCREREKTRPTRFHFKLTTNGLLLDDEFLRFSKKENLFIALSHDGTQKAQDSARRDHQGLGSYERLEKVIPRLLAVRPYAPVLMTVNPETADQLYAGVSELLGKGFRYLICSLNYAADWSSASLRELRRQYQLLAKLYYHLTANETKFYLSPFEVKIASHIQGKNYCRERCELGRRQLSVSPEGGLYPCTQFAGRKEYRIGSVREGIDEKLRLSLYLRNEAAKAECRGCAIADRCNCHCGCLNLQTTGSLERVSPIQCEHERLLTPIADRLAERLFKEKNGMFIQKHYNDVYPLISLVEDLKR